MAVDMNSILQNECTISNLQEPNVGLCANYWFCALRIIIVTETTSCVQHCTLMWKQENAIRDTYSNDISMMILCIYDVYIVCLLLMSKVDPNIDHVALHNMKHDEWIRKTPRSWTTPDGPSHTNNLTFTNDNKRFGFTDANTISTYIRRPLNILLWVVDRGEEFARDKSLTK